MSEIDDEEEEICSYVMHLERAFNKSPRTTRVNGWNEKDMFWLPTNEVVEELNRAVVMMEIISFNTQLTHNNPLESTTSRGWDQRHQRQLCLACDRPVATILVNFTWSPAEGKCIPGAGCITVASAIYTST
ncbi:uncharacterized protein LOC125207744 [Salvia hispanica]|uniref:uncharacterized protein LOC125207744 n=1 Tax=Salvia hispanica TaxID=49212 RepID=UPI0020097B0E|nr:uncharacterized protein LOC125207744 [Salvia hispanica]